MLPRAIEDIFIAIQSESLKNNVTISVSFLEMYCDRIRDLGIAYLQDKTGTKTFQNTSDW